MLKKHKFLLLTLIKMGFFKNDLGNFNCLFLKKVCVRYHCEGRPTEVNACVLNSYMVYL